MRRAGRLAGVGRRIAGAAVSEWGALLMTSYHLPVLMPIMPGVPHKIVLADDNPNILSFVQPALEREGYGVATAADGAEALYAWESEHPALLILDIEMPEPNGLAVCRKIRESGDPVPIIFLTGRDGISDLELGFSLGASDYVTKPFDIRELLARVKARLPRAVQEFDGYLRLDYIRHEVSVQREAAWTPVELTPREYDL